MKTLIIIALIVIFLFMCICLKRVEGKQNFRKRALALIDHLHEGDIIKCYDGNKNPNIQHWLCVTEITYTEIECTIFSHSGRKGAFRMSKEDFAKTYYMSIKKFFKENPNRLAKY
jgi:hypothetical protein